MIIFFFRQQVRSTTIWEEKGSFCPLQSSNVKQLMKKSLTDTREATIKNKYGTETTWLPPSNNDALLRSQCENNDFFLVILIKSSATTESAIQRAIIREHVLTQNPETFPPQPFLAIFLLAKSQSEQVNKDILKETDKHRDILIFDYRDSYKNLTLKTMSGLEWTTRHCMKTQYVMNMDQDTFVNLPKLVNHMTTFPEFYSDVMVGQCYGPFEAIKETYNAKSDTNEVKALPYLEHPRYGKFKNIVHRPNTTFNKDRKFVIGYSQYPYKYFPPYCAGGANVKPFKLVTDIVKISAFIPIFHVDDAYVGVCLHCLGYRVRMKQGFGLEYYSTCPMYTMDINDFYTVHNVPGSYFPYLRRRQTS